MYNNQSRKEDTTFRRLFNLVDGNRLNLVQMNCFQSDTQLIYVFYVTEIKSYKYEHMNSLHSFHGNEFTNLSLIKRVKSCRDNVSHYSALLFDKQRFQRSIFPGKMKIGVVIVLLGFYAVCIESGAVGHSGDRSFGRQKRSVIVSLPRGVLRFTSQIIVPVLSLLNTSNSYLWFDFQSNWPLPNNNNLNTLYTSFGRLKEKGIEVDEEFVDQQRANAERRTLYQCIEGFFTKYSLINDWHMLFEWIPNCFI